MTQSTCFIFQRAENASTNTDRTNHRGTGVGVRLMSCLWSRFVFFQVLRLSQKEQALEERLASVCQENAELRASLASLHTRLALHDQVDHQHSQQVHKQTHRTFFCFPSNCSEYAPISAVWSSMQPQTTRCRTYMNKRASITKGFSAACLRFSRIVESIAEQSPHSRHCGFRLQFWFPLMSVQFHVGCKAGISHIRISLSLKVVPWQQFERQTSEKAQG